jgi:signal transduction histidine kinase
MPEYDQPLRISHMENLIKNPLFKEDTDDAGVAKALVDSLPVNLLILDADRRIVYFNEKIKALLGDVQPELVLNKRPGEALRCMHSVEAPGGCGCSEYCSRCGAFMAIQAAMQNRKAVQECRLTDLDGTSLDFRVWTSPIANRGARFTLFSFLDISDEKRRARIEHTCFHDMMNMVSAVYGMMEVIDLNGDDRAESAQHLIVAKQCVLMLASEIRSSQALKEAESQKLAVKPSTFSVRKFIANVSDFFAINVMTRDVGIESELIGHDVDIVSDESLLLRVMVNLVMNAIEASEHGGRVSLTGKVIDDAVLFEVHNASAMEDAVVKQVFQRSFSTRGEGRGTGTYSAKLFTEKYLGGKIWFSSSATAGTSFFVRLPLHAESMKR